MLELRPNCECCDRDLGPAALAFICSFECTYCETCAVETLRGVCPNCNGELVRRPIRPAAALVFNPPSKRRVLKARGCNPREAA